MPRQRAVVGLASSTPAETYVALAKALADPTRIEMLALIGATGEYPCTELEQRLPLSKSTISYHVKILSQVGLVTVRREGRFYHYRLERDVLDHFAPNLLPDLARAGGPGTPPAICGG